MAYADKRVNIKVPQDLIDEIDKLDLVGSWTDKVIWLLKQQLKRLPKSGEKALGK